jgi:hypothetical protein
MDKGNSKIRVIDVQTEQVLFECSLDQSEQAYEYAASLEDMGLDVKVVNPTLSQTLTNSLGLSQTEVAAFEESMDHEIHEHETEEADGCVFKAPKSIH